MHSASKRRVKQTSTVLNKQALRQTNKQFVKQAHNYTNHFYLSVLLAYYCLTASCSFCRLFIGGKLNLIGGKLNLNSHIKKVTLVIAPADINKSRFLQMLEYHGSNSFAYFFVNTVHNLIGDNPFRFDK